MTDQKKLEKLFRQHYRQMYRLATVLLHDDAESKDVVHDIFAHLLRSSQDLREETAESYLLTSVRNRCMNVIRSRQIQERVEYLYLLDLDTTITPTERLEEELKALYKGINQLEPPSLPTTSSAISVNAGRATIPSPRWARMLTSIHNISVSHSRITSILPEASTKVRVLVMQKRTDYKRSLKECRYE